MRMRRDPSSETERVLGLFYGKGCFLLVVPSLSSPF